MERREARMDEGNRRRSTVLKSVDRMVEQLNNGDKSVAETIIDYMQLTGFAEDEENLANMTIEKAFEKLSNQKIVLLQENLGLYTLTSGQEVKKFYMWLNARLEKVRIGEWTKDKFLGIWDNAIDGIMKKTNDKSISKMDRIGITNIIIMINDLER